MREGGTRGGAGPPAYLGCCLSASSVAHCFSVGTNSSSGGWNPHAVRHTKRKRTPATRCSRVACTFHGHIRLHDHRVHDHWVRISACITHKGKHMGQHSGRASRPCFVAGARSFNCMAHPRHLNCTRGTTPNNVSDACADLHRPAPRDIGSPRR